MFNCHRKKKQTHIDILKGSIHRLWIWCICPSLNYFTKQCIMRTTRWQSIYKSRKVLTAIEHDGTSPYILAVDERQGISLHRAHKGVEKLSGCDVIREGQVESDKNEILPWHLCSDDIGDGAGNAQAWGADWCKL